jgi:homoserine kinase
VRLTVRVPATSANLGPGFDCFGLALDLCNEVTVDTEAEPGVSWEGEGADELPTDGSDMISRAIARAVSHEGVALPSLRMSAINRIPLERGLGSSSAAAVAGMLLGLLLAEPSREVDPAAVVELAAEIEGHPDNAAACVYGGFTLAAEGGVVRLDPHPSLRPVLLIPQARSSTRVSRRALDDRVPREDAVFNLQQSALTVVAITQRPELLSWALRDRLHEQLRLESIPEVLAVYRELAGAGVPVCLSGAGPSLIAFESEDRPVPDPGEGWRTLRPAVRALGSEVVAR